MSPGTAASAPLSTEMKCTLCLGIYPSQWSRHGHLACKILLAALLPMACACWDHGRGHVPIFQTYDLNYHVSESLFFEVTVASHARVLSVVKDRSRSKRHKKLPVWPLTKHQTSKASVSSSSQCGLWLFCILRAFVRVEVSPVLGSQQVSLLWAIIITIIETAITPLYPLMDFLDPRPQGYFLGHTSCPH